MKRKFEFLSMLLFVLAWTLLMVMEYAGNWVIWPAAVLALAGVWAARRSMRKER